jgi:ankyrin repeat protein
MRVFIYLFVILICISCRDSAVDKSKLLGNDYRLFQDTPVWELAKAVWDEDTSAVKAIMLNDKVDINYQEERFGNTLLMLAVNNEHYYSSKALLELGADPNVHDFYDGSSAILDAVNVKDTKFLELLLRFGADANDQEVGERREGNTIRYTPLLKASAESLDKVKLLVEAGADINYIDEFGVTPLRVALFQDKYSIVLFLLQKGANPKVPLINRDGQDYFIHELLREVVLPLDSYEYEEKKRIIELLNNEGLDYRKVPIPDFIVKEVKMTYPDNWQEYLEKY